MRKQKGLSEKQTRSLDLRANLQLLQTQTPEAKGPKEARRGSDRKKSSNPFLQAVASAEETLEDRDKKI